MTEYDETRMLLLCLSCRDAGINCKSVHESALENGIFLQWYPIFYQYVDKLSNDQNKTLKLSDTLRNYSYDGIDKSLTKDETKDWTLKGDKLYHNVYHTSDHDEFYDILWKITQGDDVYLFSIRHVVMPNAQILKFD